MVTDDERRRAARLMRDRADCNGSFDDHEIAGIIGTPGLIDNISWKRLADLIEPGYDRVALLELADEMELISGIGITESFTPGAVRDYAHRIREALGVTE